MNKPGSADSALPSASPLLITESAEEFEELRDAFYREINPRGITEQKYVDDIVHIVFESRRLWRWKVAIVNLAFRSALKNILFELFRASGMPVIRAESESSKLSVEWFQDEGTKKLVAKILRDFNLDESAIGAEAFRISAENIERIDRLIASSESRYSKALRSIAEHRDGLARRLREAGDRIIDGQVRALEHVSRKKPTSAA